MASPLVAPPIARAKALTCPNCGAAIELRSFGYAVNVACPNCTSLLDASNPQLKILQRAHNAQNRRIPLIPLGTRGTFRRVPWEVIGFQTRSVESDGEKFEWHEYLLFNPYNGFRYLTQYDGHWNFVTPLESMPAMNIAGVRYEGSYYKKFSKASATTSFILGEFPWRVRVGDRVRAEDYIRPPFILSSEADKNEITWSQGEYVNGEEIWKAFALPGSAPRATGIYLNQPSPYQGGVWGIWKTFFLMELLLIVVALAFGVSSKREVVVNEAHQFSTADTGEPSFTTKPFTLTGRAAPVEVSIVTNLSNNSAYFNLALINDDTGQAYDFAREVSYYFGSDSDGSWTEGSPAENIQLPAIPPGHYYLRVEPEMEADASGPKSVSYQLVVRHDSPSYIWFMLAGVLLLLPPIFYSIRAKSFEARRWEESDFQATED